MNIQELIKKFETEYLHKEDIQYAENGAKLKEIEVSDEKSVIPEGAYHKNKHDDFGLNVTKKGIPVVTVPDDSVETLAEILKLGDKLEQIAEVENFEIIFVKELTDFLEDKRKEWHDAENSAKNDILLEVGKRLTKEILENTDDNVNLIDKLDKFEEGGVVLALQGTQLFTSDNLRNQFNAVFTLDQINNMNKFYNYFSSKGYNDNQIFALMGNIMLESSFNPALTNSSGAYGYYQFKGDRLKDYNKWKAENQMTDGGLTLTLYIVDNVIKNKIDPRYNDYQRALTLSQSKNAVDRRNGQAYLNKISKNPHWVKDLHALWYNPNSTLQQLVESFGNTIEAAGADLNLKLRYNYANGFYTIKSKRK